MAYDQSELPHIGPTRREKRKIINAPGTNIRIMFEEGPMFIQTLRKKRQK